MAQNADAVAPVRPRKTLTIKSTAKAEVRAANQTETKEQTPSAAASMPKRAKVARRGRNFDMQLLQPGAIQANPGTVFGVIAALVAELGTVARAELVDAMGQTVFPSPKARAQDRAWCQGYVAGALRDGYLALVPSSPESTNNVERRDGE